MTEQAYKRLYEAQIAEHEKTTERLRTVEKENANLRGLIGSQQREHADAIEVLQGMALVVLKAFPVVEKNPL